MQWDKLNMKLSTLIFFFFVIRNMEACPQCPEKHPQTKFCIAKNVAVIQVTGQPITERNSNKVVYPVKVNQILKVSQDKFIVNDRIWTLEKGECGFASLKNGEIYLVSLYLRDGDLRPFIHKCNIILAKSNSTIEQWINFARPNRRALNCDCQIGDRRLDNKSCFWGEINKPRQTNSAYCARFKSKYMDKCYWQYTRY